ncbi:MAG: transcriptional regulator NrdR [Pseudomonadota bacterium]
MKCPFCESKNTSVKDSRETDESRVIRRRRHCSNCNGRFTTFERIQFRELVVVKRTGSKRPFDRTKILKSITTALRKRNFTNEDIEKLSDRIVLELESSTTKEIKSKAIGKLIMQELAKIDPVAYIRFASVYKDFSNAQDFAKFISKIKN